MSRSFRILRGCRQYEQPTLRTGRSISSAPESSSASRGSAGETSSLGFSRSPAAYLKDLMDRSPIRRCIVTRLDLPSDYLVRFVPRLEYFPEPSSATPIPSNLSPNRSTLTPSAAMPRRPIPATGILSHKGIWVSCRRDAVDTLTRPGRHLGSIRQIPNLQVPANIAEQVEEQLRQRVISELRALGMTALKVGRDANGRNGGSRGTRRGVMRTITAADANHLLRGNLGLLRSGEADSGITAILDIADLSSTPSPPSSLLSLAKLAEELGLPCFDLFELLPLAEREIISALVELLPSMESGDTADGRKLLGAEGMARVPLVKALLRLRMWSGVGWHDPDASLLI